MARYLDYLIQKKGYYGRNPKLGPQGTRERTLCEERRALRSEHFKKEQKKHAAPTKAQKRLAWQDPGFG